MNRWLTTSGGMLGTVWLRPRLALWIPALALLPALVRGGMAWFAPAMIVPHFIWIDPGVVLTPLLGMFAGPAGVWAAVAGSALGDGLGGEWGPLSVWRAVGMGLWALSAQMLWDATFWRASPAPAHRPHWGPTFRFLWCAWPGAVAAALCAALGSDLNRLYVFPYAFTLHAAHHMLFSWLLGVALYRIAAREFSPVWGTWRRRAGLGEAEASVSLGHAALLALLALGAAAASLAYARLGRGFNMFEPYVLGLHIGARLIWILSPFLALGLLAALWPGPRRKRP